MRKNHSFLNSMKGLTFLCMTFCSFVVKGQTLVGQTVDALPGDAFTYQSQSMPNYGIKWTSDSWYPGASTAWLSSYHGFKFFTWGSSKMAITREGYVGIGTDAPTQRLEVKEGFLKVGNVGAGQSGSQSVKNFVNLGSDNHGSVILSSNIYTDGNIQGNKLRVAIPHSTLSGSAIIIPGNALDQQNSIIFHTSVPHAVLGDEVFNSPRMIITAAGNVGIGTMSPTEMLSIKGKIRAQELKIEAGTTGNWPDYVFKPTYKLTPLPELEQFIKTHQHLPEVPSAKDVAVNGIEVGMNQALLLKKIEELTLHIIEMNKTVELLNKKVGQLEKRTAIKL